MIRRRKPSSIWDIEFEELVNDELYEIIYGIRIDKKKRNKK